MRAPPDFPSGLHTTSIAAFPFNCRTKKHKKSKPRPSDTYKTINRFEFLSQRLVKMVYLGFFVQGNVRHLLARVEQTVLRTLTEDVLKGTNVHSGQQGRHAETSEHGRQGSTEEHQTEKGDSSYEQNCRRDGRCHSPPVFPENVSTQQHHDERRHSRVRREVSHER